ncbi:Fur-regulated basic protein FbpA [Neobacillus notoginsengisoli]|uniref:Fur-regulated basic protein FbpA n=1 Tax=Neobacillus notoginsengisoli TaxID=1578198 RepID=UPI001F03212E|nr:Fur-regulated basic protein FbpA [Neobacillus notoginsengisoli]
MSRLSKLVERRKEQLIEELLMRDIYKTSDEKHLYDAPLKTLENEYRLVLEKEAGE